jgi:hypothetical protein
VLADLLLWWIFGGIGALFVWRVLLPRFDAELDQEERDREWTNTK